MFDQWVHNIDRLKRNILLQPQPRKGGYKLYIIDHDHSFSFETPSHKRSCRWTPYTLKFLPRKIKPNILYNWFAHHARSRMTFSSLWTTFNAYRMKGSIKLVPPSIRLECITGRTKHALRLPCLIDRYLRKS